MISPIDSSKFGASAETATYSYLPPMSSTSYSRMSATSRPSCSLPARRVAGQRVPPCQECRWRFRGSPGLHRGDDRSSRHRDQRGGPRAGHPGEPPEQPPRFASLPDCPSAIRASLRPGVTGDVAGADLPGQGNGLPHIVRQLRIHRGRLVLRWGTGIARVATRQRVVSVPVCVPGTWAWMRLDSQDGQLAG